MFGLMVEANGITRFAYGDVKQEIVMRKFNEVRNMNREMLRQLLVLPAFDKIKIYVRDSAGNVLVSVEE